MDANLAAHRHGARRAFFTALRAAACLLLVWAFLSGGSPLSIGLPAILAVAMVAALLAVYELSIRGAAMEWVAGTVFFILCLSGLGYGVWYWTRPPEPTGPLLPANDATPPTTCRDAVASRGVVIVAAENRLVADGSGPFKALTVDDCPVLQLRRAGRGLMVDATFYDWTDDIAFRVADDIYTPFMPLRLRSFRPDPHTLVILDRFDQEVLYIRFLNPHALRLRGRFLCGEQSQVVIGDRAVLVGGTRIGGVYFGQRRDRRRVCATARTEQPGLVLGAP